MEPPEPCLDRTSLLEAGEGRYAEGTAKGRV